MAKNTIVVSITGNASGLRNALGDGESALSKFGKVAGAVALAAGVAIGAVAVSAFKAVAEIEKLNAQTVAALKSTGNAAGRSIEQINGLAQSLERMSGIEAEVIQSGQNMLLTFTQIKGVNFDRATAAALDLSVAMGTDMQQASVLVGKALNDPIAGMSALSRVGVQLTADQKAAVKQMVELGDVAGAQAVILGVLNEQFGGSAEAFGGTFLGNLEKVKNSFGNITEALVAGLLPAATLTLGGINTQLIALADSDAFNKLVTGVNDFTTALFAGEVNFTELFSNLLSGAVNGVTDAANWLATGGAETLVNGLVSSREAMFDAAFKVFPVILDALVTAIPAIVSGLAALVTQLADMLVTQAPIILQGAVTLFTSLLDALVTILPGLITTLIGLLPVIVGTILSLIPQLLDAAVEAFTALVDAIPVILPPLIQTIVDILPSLVETIIGLIPKILEAAVSLFLALVEALPVILPLLIKAVIDLLPKLIEAVLSMLPKLLEAAIDLFIALVEAVPKIIPDLIGSIVGLLPSLIGAIIGLIPSLIKAGGDLIGGLVKGLIKAGGAVGGALLDIAKNAVGGFLSFLGIASPSKLFAGFGKNTVQGLVKGLNKNASLVDRSMDGISARVAGGFRADIAAPNFALTSSSSASASPLGNIYNITVSTLNADAETGRVIVQSIRDYELAGGRL